MSGPFASIARVTNVLRRKLKRSDKLCSLPPKVGRAVRQRPWRELSHLSLRVGTTGDLTT